MKKESSRPLLTKIMLLLNVVALIYSVIVILDGRVMRHISYGYIATDDYPLIFLFIFSIINVAYSLSPVMASSNGLASLWYKRRQLEEQKRIKELEEKD